MRLTAGRLRSISPTWSDWVPVWTTSTGVNTPSFGNAAVIARFAQSALTVYWRMEITFGATTNFGGGGASDNWRFSLPVNAAATSLIAGYGEISDSSAGLGSRMGVRSRLTTATTMEIEMAAGRIDSAAAAGVGLIDAASPWAWASGDTIRVFGEYEAAA
ncbi:hypothetical protein A4E84_20170 [Streptomyces qaidamensis]|uniref:Uncharacterized protein n=2 Tax=Streptomyces qaidamensis TaxID=1783515 RepID=A0A143C3K9_9ACTN|nr:hypothetical protein A4E84_20170 [Streptomyces qaidamensis]